MNRGTYAVKHVCLVVDLDRSRMDRCIRLADDFPKPIVLKPSRLFDKDAVLDWISQKGGPNGVRRLAKDLDNADQRRKNIEAKAAQELAYKAKKQRVKREENDEETPWAIPAAINAKVKFPPELHRAFMMGGR